MAARQTIPPTVRSDCEIRILALVRLSQLQKLTGLNLRKVSFRGMDLKGAHWRDCHLDKADLSAADLSAAIFDGSTLDESKLVSTKAHKTSFAGCSLRNADLSEFQALGASFVGAHFDSARIHPPASGELNVPTKLQSADLSGAVLVDAHLPGLDLSKATLTGAILKNAYLDGANFKGAINITRKQLVSARGRIRALHAPPAAKHGPKPQTQPTSQHTGDVNVASAPTADELLSSVLTPSD